MKTCLILSMITWSQIISAQLKPDTYDTSYIDGYIVTVDSVYKTALIKPVIKMQIYVTKQLPCSILYVWRGEDKGSDGWYHTVSKYDSTKNNSPCGNEGIYIMFPSKYKGDTLIETNCTSGSYSVFKELYFIPDKKKKRKLGKQYELKLLDYYGETDKWERPPFIIICG